MCNQRAQPLFAACSGEEASTIHRVKPSLSDLGRIAKVMPPCGDDKKALVTQSDRRQEVPRSRRDPQRVKPAVTQRR